MQPLADLQAVGRAFAGRVNGTRDPRRVVRERGLDLRAARRGDGLLLAAPGALQLQLAPRVVQRGLGRIQHQLARAREVARQPLGGQHALEALAAARGQGQQRGRAVLGGAAVAGAQEIQPPAPLVRVPPRAQLERRVGRQHQLGQLCPDAGVGQGLYVAVAQLRAIAPAGPRAGMGLIDDCDLKSPALEFVGRRQAHDARAHDTYMHCELWQIADCPNVGRAPAIEQCQSRRGT